MKTSLRLATILPLSLVTTAFAAQPEYASIDQFLSTLTSDLIRLVVGGDLNGDGLSDRVVVAHQPNTDISPKLYVLIQLPSGNFVVANRTKVFSSHTGSVEPVIKRGSLYVHLETIKPGNGQVTHQFKLYRGAWRLIGVTRLYPVTGNPNEDAGVRFVTTDTNLLTGQVVETNTDTKQVTRRREPVPAPCLLADYDFDFGFCSTR